MSWRMTLLAAAIIIAGGIAATSAGFAEDTPANNPAPQGQGMMGGQQDEGMVGENGGMMGMRKMMTQMTRMVENCNRVMERANNNPPAPAKPPAQPSPG